MTARRDILTRARKAAIFSSPKFTSKHDIHFALSNGIISISMKLIYVAQTIIFFRSLMISCIFQIYDNDYGYVPSSAHRVHSL